ncbi:MAG: hypothetical protein GY782_08655 [Gammaproteobacteria bacterium]|nr:hypothetical protein [Gammaproteobacteria bacterium]
MTKLEAALRYLKEYKFSVIPCKANKKAYVKWEEFQKRQATEDEIKEWWAKWPDANIAVVTGKVSGGLAIIDIDEQKGFEAIQEYIPDTLEFPISKTPSGGEHFWFRTNANISNNSRVVPGCDLRAEGGYVLVPPSANGNGKQYSWKQSIKDIAVPFLPDAYIKYILLNNKYSLTRAREGVNPVTFCDNLLHSVTLSFSKGTRDEDFFHVMHCLIKGGMSQDNAREVAHRLLLTCEQPGGDNYTEREVEEKIKSAIHRLNIKERNIMQEVRDYLVVTSGDISVTSCYNELHFVTKEQKATVRQAFKRLADEGMIERSGTVAGRYRIVDRAEEEMDFLNASTDRVDIKLPLAIHDLCYLMPKNIVIVSGTSNAGKTTFLLNLVRENMHNHKFYYFNSEMEAGEFKGRLTSSGLSPEQWKVKVFNRTHSFHDIIRPDDINIIDYMQIHDNFYEVGKFINAIFEKLKKGLCFIALQKNRNVDFGLGGERSIEKARLALAIDYNKLKIVKGKNKVDRMIDPNRMWCNFRLENNFHFIKTSEWRLD